jgi:hypothetical protein
VRRLRGVLVLLGVALLVYALARPVLQVKNAHGDVCGSAWRSAHRELPRTGARSPAEIEADLNACEGPGDRALRHALEAGAAGLVLLLGVAVWPVRRRNDPVVVPARR